MNPVTIHTHTPRVVTRRARMRDDAIEPATAAARSIARFIAYACAGASFGVSLSACLVALISLDDLQSDFINPHDCARRVNRATRVEVIAHVLGAAFTLVSGHWVAFAVNAPLMWWHWER